MHDALESYFKSQINQASEFVVNRIEINIDADEVYETLLGEPHVVQAFREAAKYLESKNHTGTHKVHIGKARTCYLRLNLPSTDRYPVHLIPQYAMQITQESKLAQALTMPLSLSRSWQELDVVTRWAFVNHLHSDQVAFLLPWLRDLIVNSSWHDNPEAFLHHWGSGKVTKRALSEVHTEVKQIISGVAPNRFPRLTKRVNEVCRSGKQLFGQYRMLQASDERDRHIGDTLVVAVLRNEPVSNDLIQELDQVTEAWQATS